MSTIRRKWNRGMIENNAYSSFSVPCHDIANVVEFAPYDWCPTLLAVGTNSRVSIYQCVFDQEVGINHHDFYACITVWLWDNLRFKPILLFFLISSIKNHCLSHPLTDCKNLTTLFFHIFKAYSGYMLM
jgi:hypothetical protein